MTLADRIRSLYEILDDPCDDEEQVRSRILDLLDAIRFRQSDRFLLTDVFIRHARAHQKVANLTLSETVSWLVVDVYGQLLPSHLRRGFSAVVAAERAGFVYASYIQTRQLIRGIVERLMRHAVLEKKGEGYVICNKEYAKLYEKLIRVIRVFGQQFKTACLEHPTTEISPLHVLFALDLADSYQFGWFPPSISEHGKYLFSEPVSDVWCVAFMLARQQIRTDDFFKWLDEFGGSSLQPLFQFMLEGLIDRKTIQLILEHKHKDKKLDEERVRAALTAWRDLEYRRPLDLLLKEPLERLRLAVETQARTARDNTLF
jgi:hypothetical protein